MKELITAIGSVILILGIFISTFEVNLFQTKAMLAKAEMNRLGKMVAEKKLDAEDCKKFIKDSFTDIFHVDKADVKVECNREDEGDKKIVVIDIRINSIKYDKKIEEGGGNKKPYHRLRLHSIYPCPQ